MNVFSFRQWLNSPWDLNNEVLEDKTFKIWFWIMFIDIHSFINIIVSGNKIILNLKKKWSNIVNNINKYTKINTNYSVYCNKFEIGNASSLIEIISILHNWN